MKNERIIILFLISTLSQFPLSLIRFIIPIYAKSIGADTFILGMMGSAYGLVYIILAPYFGKISDKIGHKKMIICGLIIYALVVLIYPYIQNPLFLIFIRGGEALGMAMVWPSIEAFSQIAKEEKIEHSIMIYTLSWSIAASVAPYIGAIFIDDFKIAILIVFIVSIFAAIVSIFIPAYKNLKINIKERKFDIFNEIVIPIFIYGFNSAIILSFYPAYGDFIGLGVMKTGIILTVSGLFMVIAFICSGTIISKYNKIWITFLGIVLQFPFFFVSYYNDFYIQLISLSLIFFGQGLIYFNVLVNIVISFSNNVGSKTGLFESSIGLGFILGPLLGGLPTILKFHFPWIISLIFSIIIFFIYTNFLIKLYKNKNIIKS